MKTVAQNVLINVSVTVVTCICMRGAARDLSFEYVLSFGCCVDALLAWLGTVLGTIGSLPVYYWNLVGSLTTLWRSCTCVLARYTCLLPRDFIHELLNCLFSSFGWVQQFELRTAAI